MPEYEAFDPFAGLPSPGQGAGEGVGYVLRETPASVVASAPAVIPAPAKQEIASSQPMPTGYKNPEAGKILGYIYEKSGPAAPDTTIAGVPVVKKGSGDNAYYEAMPGTRPDLVQDGIGYAVANRGSDNETWIPISSAPAATEAEYSVKPTGGRAIPLYQPFFTPSWRGRPMTQEELFSSAAIMAGATDAPIKVSGLGPGVGQSHMFSEEVRKGFGLPQSFDMFRGVDPTKPDWGASKWSIYNPTSHGVFGDFFTSLAETGPIGTLAMIAMGIPPVLAGAISGGSSAYAADGNLLKGIATGALSGGAGQMLQVALPGITSALGATGATALESAIDSGILGGAPAATGIAGLLQSASALTGIPTEVIAGAAKGAASAAISGGDPLQGALTGAVSSGTGTALAGVEGFKDLDPAVQKLISSAAKGAATAAVSGRDPFDAAVMSGLSSLGSSVSQAFAGASAQPSPDSPSVGTGVDADELINQMIRAQEPITPMEQLIDYAPEVTPVEPPPDLRAVELPSEAETFPVLSPEQPLSQQDLTDQLVETFPVAPPEEITEAPASLDDIISQLQEQAQQQQTLEQVLAGPQETVTPTEDWIDQGRLVSSPLQIEIAGYGQEAPYEYATPTEDWIDTGGLGGAPYEYSTPTEDWIDRGGLGGTPTETPIGIGATGPGGGSTTGGGTGGGTKQPTGPSATDQLLQQLQQQQRQSDMSSLMAMLGIMGASQQKAAPPPIPLVGEIKPYQFSTDLLEGIYQTPKMAQGGSINELMRILRG